MQRLSLRAAVVLFLVSATAFGADLTLTQGGRVSIELITSDAAFRNTMSVTSPSVGIAARGCQLEPSNGLPGRRRATTLRFSLSRGRVIRTRK